MSNEYLNNKSFEEIIDLFQRTKKKKIRIEFKISDLNETLERMKRIKNCNKLDSIEIQKEIHSLACEDYFQYQDQLAQAFYVLAENIANCTRFNGVDIDDAIQEGVLICFEKVDRFDPRKGKAFNYMTTCILNHFRQIYRSIRNYHELKKRYHNHLQDKFENVFIRNGKERANMRASYDDLSNSGV